LHRHPSLRDIAGPRSVADADITALHVGRRLGGYTSIVVELFDGTEIDGLALTEAVEALRDKLDLQLPPAA